MKGFGLALALLGTALLPAAVGAVELPLSTSSRWIVDATGERVKLRCVNWAGHMEVNIPEGLHKQPVESIADKIRDLGFNCVRLTFSIDHALNPDISLADSFSAAAEATGVNLDDLLARVAEKNPFGTATAAAGDGTVNANVNATDVAATVTTRDVFSAVISALWDRGIMTILDNHVSKASWCCHIDDGNGWWDAGFGYNDMNSRHFHTQNWLDGLSAMSKWAASQPGVVGMGLRNEVREWLLQGLNGREDWYEYMAQGARLVHAAHPDALILIGGTLSSTDLIHIKARGLDWSDWAGKHVWEWHAYSFTVTFPNSGADCGFTKNQYGFNNGFVLEQGRDYTAPLILSEFGFGMAGGPRDGLSDKERVYFDCLRDYLVSNDGEWAIWGIMGSYYVRDGTADFDEGYGVLDRDWAGLRNPKLPELLAPLFKQTQGPE